MVGRSVVVLAALVLAGGVLACTSLNGRGDPPPSPTKTIEPMVVGVVAAVDPDPEHGYVTLDSGVVLAVRENDLKRIYGGYEPAPGTLILAGGGQPPGWWASFELKPQSETSIPDPTGRDACWRITNGAFDEGDFIHFANGLHLRKAAGFLVVPDYIKDPFPARPMDSFCLDRRGEVMTLDFIWQPI